MNYFVDLLAEMKERIRNPLVSSFVVSWFISNWFLVYVLFFANADDIKDYSQHPTNLAFILSLINIKNGFCTPFLMSLFYTFIFPFLKGWIQSFNLWLKKYFSAQHFLIDQTRSISLKKYLELREKLNEDLDQVHRHILDDDQRKLELQSEKLLNQSLKDDIDRKNSEVTQLKNKLIATYNPTELDGYWTFELIGGRSGIRKKIDLYIQDSRIYSVNTDNSRALISKIEKYFKHPEGIFMYIEFSVIGVGYPDRIISEIPKVIFTTDVNQNWIYKSSSQTTQINFQRKISG